MMAVRPGTSPPTLLFARGEEERTSTPTPPDHRRRAGWGLRWIPVLLLAAPVLAQHDGHDDHDQAPAAVEAAHEEHAAESTGRPIWVAPIVILLLLGAGVTAPLARRFGRERLGGPSAAVLALVALALLVATRPGAAPGGEEPGHEEPGHNADEDAVVQVDPAALAALGLETETVAPSDLAVGLDATGRIVAVESREAHVGSRISGRLTSVRVEVGERVTAGQVVATLDSVDAAQAAAAWREAVARHEAARRNLATRQELVASGTFTAGPLEDARRQLAEARTEQAKAASELAQARNESDAAKAELGRTQRLVASGTFTTAAVEEARQRLAEAERGLAEARSAVAGAEADRTAAQGELRIASQRVASAQALADRTAGLAATGELDRGPLEQAQNALADARSRLQQVTASLDQTRRQLARGEELYRNELISLNELESRRTAETEQEAQHREASSAVANANSALDRQERISSAKMASGRAVQEARNAVDEAERELAAAKARLTKAGARIEVVRGGLPPAEQAVDTARSTIEREQALAKDETRSGTALEEAKLRVSQAERIVSGKEGEVAEAGRKVDVATAVVKREERLSAGRVRAREQLLDSEREVRAAAIAKDNAAEVLQILGSSPSAAQQTRGPLQIPVRSPLSGLVTELDAAVGEAVSAEQNLMSVIDLTEVYVEADVYEKDLPRLAEGQLVSVEVRSQPGERFLGSVVSISSKLDPETRAAHVRALLQNPGWRLKPGMFATVGFVTDRQAGALTVSGEAVQEVEGRPTVFVQQASEQFEARTVVLGRRDGERIELTSGLTAGEVVVTKGSYLLKSQQMKGELGEGHAH